ncbi:hypothetical protein [Pseudomonas umsongensis]|jgi:hypothetical protein|uniref:hypothetical protein n=1 Tax=Pseudomonas umsongensis TaxID=198618 RepID=UPI0015B98C79|nr:hypothetical protein [Pseudomonas umsongensis]NWL19516.1 hypothetical protein [Pseudomonas umsongensis]
MLKIRLPKFLLFFVFGMILLAFSTSPEDGGVLSFGTPFFIASMLAFIPVIHRFFSNVDWRFFLFPSLYIFLIVVMTGFSFSPLQSSVRAAFNVIGFVLYLGLICSFLSGRLSVQMLARILICSGAILALYFIVNFLLSSIELGVEQVILERYVGGAMSLPWGASNTIAQVLLLSAVSYLILDDRRKFDFLMFCLITAGIFLTFSRSNMLLLFVLFFVVFKLRQLIVVGAVSGLALAVFFAYMVVFAGWDLSGFDTFVSSRTDVDLLVTGNGRLQTMMEKIDYLADHPFEPIGYYSSLFYFELSAHNFWMTSLIEQSLAAVLVALCFFFSVGRTVYRRDRKVFFGFLIIMAALMVEDPHFTQQYITSFWVFLALLVGFGSTEKDMGVENES